MTTIIYHWQIRRGCSEPLDRITRRLGEERSAVQPTFGYPGSHPLVVIMTDLLHLTWAPPTEGDRGCLVGTLINLPQRAKIRIATVYTHCPRFLTSSESEV